MGCESDAWMHYLVGVWGLKFKSLREVRLKELLTFCNVLGFWVGGLAFSSTPCRHEKSTHRWDSRRIESEEVSEVGSALTAKPY